MAVLRGLDVRADAEGTRLTDSHVEEAVDVQGDLVVQSGGTDPGSLALEFAQSADDYKSTQANKFYNAFMGALGGNLGG